MTRPEIKMSTDNAITKDQRVSTIKPRYEEIINWLISNPTHPLKDCAAYFGVRREWMGVIVNTDAFRARLRERQDEVFHTCVLDLREKAHGAAHEAIDRLMEKLHTIEDPMQLLKAVDTLFDKLGYGAKGNIGAPANFTQNTTNNIVVGADQLSNARAIMDKALALREIPPAGAELPPTELPPASAGPGTSLSTSDDDSSPLSSPRPKAEGPLLPSGD